MVREQEGRKKATYAEGRAGFRDGRGRSMAVGAEEVGRGYGVATTTGM
jgi:hypothetical protein